MTARILVVDDIPANVKLLEARLTAEYFDVTTAMSGIDAHARRLVRHLSFLIERVLRFGRFPRHPVPDHHLLVLEGFGAIPLEPVRHRHASLSGRLRGGIGGAIDQPLEDRARLGVSENTVKLAWLLQRSPVMLPIPGTLSLEHLRENLAALDVELDDADRIAT